MTNLPKKITFAYDYIIKKTTKKPNAPKQKRIHLRQKSTEWSCRDTGHLAFPKGVCYSLRGSGVHAGDTGSPWGSSSSLVACLQRQGAEATAQTELWGPVKGFATHFWHISGATAQLWHGHTKVNTINIFFAKNSSCLVVKNE